MKNYNETKILEFNNGDILRKAYYLNDTLHRIDGPALVWYERSGKLISKTYYITGRRHRVDGPAIIDCTEPDRSRDVYFIDDQQIYICSDVNIMRQSENKTATFLEILNRHPQQKRACMQILTNMFRTDIDKNVLDNLEMFL